MTEPVPPGLTPPPAEPAEEEWQRLHPLSPLLRGGVVLLAVLGYVISRLVDDLLSSIDVGSVPGGSDGEVPPGSDPLEQAAAHPLLALVALVAVLAAVGLVGWVSWRYSRFRVSRSQVELRTGVLFRQHRQVPLERIQAVELGRPILARLTGLAQVVVQAAGGSDSNLTLAFLDQGRAEALRLHLLDLAGRTDERPSDVVPAEGATAAEAGNVPWGRGAAPAGEDAVPLVSVPNGRLFVATLLHGSTIVLGGLLLVVAGGAGSVGAAAIVLGGLPAMLPVAFGVAVSRVRELLTHGNFSLARTPTALRVRHGLTDLRVATVPLHRVQAVEVLQPLWWRPWGWWRVRVNVAGVHGSGDGAMETVLLPVGGLVDVLTVLSALGARPGDPRLVEALAGEGGEDGWVGQPRRARWLDPWVWRRSGYFLAPHAVLIRRGLLTRRAVVVPHARVQSLSLEQGPLERRLGLGSATIVSTPGPVAAVVPHLSTEDAERFLDHVARLASQARRAVAGPGHGPVGGAPTAPLAPGGAPLVD